MKFETFKAGVRRQQYLYKSFSPASVDHAWSWEDSKINTLLERAMQALGELNAYSLIVPDIDLFIQMHVVKEANQSSRIEGTQTGMDEALMPEEQIAPEKRDDWREVRNYVDAMNEAVTELKRLPLSNRLLKQTHATLLRGVRGEHKQPGEFRTSQNWIGGASLADAVFIPPHQDEVAELMSDLEKFWHDEHVDVPHLIRVAISHYQFETIHPFCDGNGRIGRLLIPLYFIGHGLLDKPSLYLSDYFERHRAHYYDALMRVRVSNDMIHWVRFFLTGVAETAARGKVVFHNILALRGEVEQALFGMGRRAQSGRDLLNLLYRSPFVTAGDISAGLGISTPTANALIREFVKMDILKQVSGMQRNRVFAFERYFNLFLS
ncbi:MAG: cell filamentation protein Fic [Hydrogenophilales bacterium 28-61-23]|nr:MAG: cell filamentation protein Fic [Hydrogenophilales bacterium 28-61-23]